MSTPPARRAVFLDKPAFGAPIARATHDALVATIAENLARLSPVDRNRVLLSLAVFINIQLEALETDTTT